MIGQTRATLRLMRRCRGLARRMATARCAQPRARIEPLDSRFLMDAALLLSVNPGPLAYSEGQGPVAVDPALSVSSSPGATLTGATARLAGYRPGEDLFAVGNANGLSIGWDATDGALTLSGAAPVSTYQAALRSVTFADFSGNPQTSPRAAEFTVIDGDSTTAEAGRAILITATNTPPSILSPPAQTIAEGGSLTFGPATGNAIVISDVDANGAVEQVTLTTTHGRATLAETAGLSFTTGTGADDAVMSFTGTLDRIDAALDGLSFTPDAEFAGAATLEVSADDLGNTGAGGPQTVNVIVPINVIGNTVTVVASAPSATPTAGDPPPPLPSPPPFSVTPVPPPASPPPFSTAPVPPPAAPLTGKARLAASLAGASDANAKPGAERQLTFEAGASLADSSSNSQPSGGAMAATADSASSGAAASPQKDWPVIYTPPPARPLDCSAFFTGGRSAHAAWGRHFSLVTARLVAAVASTPSNGATDPDHAHLLTEPDGTPARPAPRRPRSSLISVAAIDADRDADPTRWNVGMWHELDRLHRRITSDTSLRVWAGTACIVSAGAAVAWFLWMSRAGAILSGLLSAMPAWRSVDPLPVFDDLARTAAAVKRNADDV